MSYEQFVEDEKTLFAVIRAMEIIGEATNKVRCMMTLQAVIIEDRFLRQSLNRLVPNLDVRQALTQLLLNQTQRNLLVHRQSIRFFEQKYSSTLDELALRINQADVSFELEQDYFDWELAVTATKELKEDIITLRKML
jgi:hypothetical protein